MGALFCGIDVGTTNVKATFVNTDGETVWTRAAPSVRRSDGVGVATDAGALVACLEEMIIAGWREVGGGVPLAAIAVAGVGEDGVGVTADLAPTDLAIPWFDHRAAAEAATLRRHFAADEARSGMAVDPSRTAAKWLWLRRSRPKALAAAHYWIALTDYPAVVWAHRPFMSETLAARTACYDVHARTWIPAMLETAGAPPLPPVLVAGTVVGGVEVGSLRQSGAASGATKVVAGGHDHPIAASAIRRIDPEALVDSMGTANLVYGEVRAASLPMRHPYLAFSVPVRGTAAFACLGVFEFAQALEPLKATAAGAAIKLCLAEASIPGMPGRSVPLPDSITPAASETDAVTGARIALESCCLYARRMFDAMHEAGVGPGPIHATGGWARSEALLELRASVFGVPIRVVCEPELTAVGAALLAGDGTGADLAVRRMHRPRTVAPRSGWVTAYDGLYADFRERLDGSRRFWSRKALGGDRRKASPVGNDKSKDNASWQ